MGLGTLCILDDFDKPIVTSDNAVIQSKESTRSGAIMFFTFELFRFLHFHFWNSQR